MYRQPEQTIIIRKFTGRISNVTRYFSFIQYIFTGIRAKKFKYLSITNFVFYNIISSCSSSIIKFVKITDRYTLVFKISIVICKVVIKSSVFEIYIEPNHAAGVKPFFSCCRY